MAATPARRAGAAAAAALALLAGAADGAPSLRRRSAVRTAPLHPVLQLQQLDKEGPSASEGIAHLLTTLGKFKTFAAQSRQQADARLAQERQGLEASIMSSGKEEVKLALQQSVTSNTAVSKQMNRIFGTMATFSSEMQSLLATTGGSATQTCEEITCGEHASCTTTLQGAKCICNEGYVGLGQDCHPPPAFLPHPLIKGNTMTKAEEIYVAMFDTNAVAIVYRDAAVGGAGRIVVGRVRAAGVADLSPPEQFTLAEGQAFAPVVAGTTSKRLVVAWRDASRGGACWIRGALLGGTGIRGADLAITWGEPVNFCKEQAHKMAIVPLIDDKFALMYSDKSSGGQQPTSLLAGAFGGGESFGNSLLGSVGASGAVTVAGQARFLDEAVVRLEVTKVTPTSFVLAARAAKAIDDVDPTKSSRQEALAMYAQLVDNDLVFDPNVVSLEPSKTQMWARGVSLVAPNTVAYAYQSAADMDVKLAMLTVDPKTNHLSSTGTPKVIHKGLSPYVSMISVPYTLSDPHTLVYFEDEATQTSSINVCTWASQTKTLQQCESFPWLNQKVESVSAVRLGGGKSFFVFATEEGVPYYGMVGLSKK